jgi:hypothetical protein
MLENEFGTTREEDVVQQILEKGEIQEVTVCILFPSMFSKSKVFLTVDVCRVPNGQANAMWRTAATLPTPSKFRCVCCV